MGRGNGKGSGPQAGSAALRERDVRASLESLLKPCTPIIFTRACARPSKCHTWEPGHRAERSRASSTLVSTLARNGCPCRCGATKAAPPGIRGTFGQGRARRGRSRVRRQKRCRCWERIHKYRVSSLETVFEKRVEPEPVAGDRYEIGRQHNILNILFIAPPPPPAAEPVGLPVMAQVSW